VYRDPLCPNIWKHGFVIADGVSIILKWISRQSGFNREMAVNLADSGIDCRYSIGRFLFKD
jgi:hypothetical protein